MNAISEEDRKRIEAERELEQTAWEDLTTEQKVERTREVVKRQVSRLEYDLTKTKETVERLKNHSHQNEKIVVPMQSFYGGTSCSEKSARATVNYF